MAKGKSKIKAPSASELKRRARAAPEICGCPSGSRVRVRDGESVCETRDGKRVGFDCSTRVRRYEIGAPNTKTSRQGKAAGVIITGPGLDYTTASQPCMSSRKACPVQLVFKSGAPHLRFCRTAGSGEPGYLVPTPDPSAARKLSAEACAQWNRDGKKFTPTNPAVVAAKAAGVGTGEDNALGSPRAALGSIQDVPPMIRMEVARGSTVTLQDGRVFSPEHPNGHFPARRPRRAA